MPLRPWPGSFRMVTLVVAGALLVPAAAFAGTVSLDPGFTFRAAPGEVNDVTVRYRVDPSGHLTTVVDLGASLMAGRGCHQETPVRCDSRGAHTLYLGDRDDKAATHDPSIFTDRIYGEGGDDEIYGDGEVAYVYGGPGADRMRINGNGVIGYGGPGDDRIEGSGNRAVGTSFHGEGGDDVVIQLASEHCTLEGGPGRDRLLGGEYCRQSGGPGADGLAFNWARPTTGGASGTSFSGEGGRDTIVAGPGHDTIDGGPGGDFIQAAIDGVADTVVCGPGRDTVRANAVDDVAADCEIVTRVEPPAAG